MFGLSEIIHDLINPSQFVDNSKSKINLRDLFLTWEDFRRSFGAMVRGGLLGFFVGVLPGAGATIASFLSYGLEKRLSKTPEKFGTGMIEGVAGPESANNSASSGAFVPLLTLGIPGSGSTAVLIGAFIILGIQPGPRMMTEHPDIAWGLIASMYVGNVMLLAQNILLVPFFIWLLRVSRNVMPVIVATVCVVGVYSIDFSMWDVWLMLMFTALGYVFRVVGIPGAPLVIALVLGQSAEFSLRQSLVISMGSPAIFFTRPISIVLFALAAACLLYPLVRDRLRGLEETE
jgi:putative tricarboxylic transport membrane protein